MRTRILTVLLLAGVLAGCGGRSSSPSDSRDAAGSAPRAVRSKHPGTLDRHDVSLATRVAKEAQHRVDGVFVGATAFSADLSQINPINLDSRCAKADRLLIVRVVWDSANFDHGGIPIQPDGPRKAQLIAVLPGSGHVCERGAKYRNVGAAANETLLYGRWPKPEDS